MRKRVAYIGLIMVMLFGIGDYDWLTRAALGLAGLSALLFGLSPFLSPLLLNVAKKMGSHRLERDLSRGITLMDALACIPLVILGLLFTGALVLRLFYI